MNNQQRKRLINIASQDKEQFKTTVILLTQIFQASFDREVGGKNKNIFNLQASAKIGQAATDIINLIDKEEGND